jgi:hypothetical protein
MRPIRWSLDPLGTNDPGLHANATEFNTALESVLEAAIAAAAEHRDGADDSVTRLHE